MPYSSNAARTSPTEAFLVSRLRLVHPASGPDRGSVELRTSSLILDRAVHVLHAGRPVHQRSLISGFWVRSATERLARLVVAVLRVSEPTPGLFETALAVDNARA